MSRLKLKLKLSLISRCILQLKKCCSLLNKSKKGTLPKTSSSQSHKKEIRTLLLMCKTPTELIHLIKLNLKWDARAALINKWQRKERPSDTASKRQSMSISCYLATRTKARPPLLSTTCRSKNKMTQRLNMDRLKLKTQAPKA